MNSQQQRITATVTYVADNEFYFIARSMQDDVEAVTFIDYFVPAQNLERTSRGFHDVQIGTRVSLIPIDGPKGPRGIEVRILS